MILEAHPAGQTARKALLRVLAGESLATPPVWLMRQAGRYLSEYKATRAKAGSFLDLCYTPEMAIEVTLQPIRRFGFDASIVFSDILVVPHALGLHLEYREGEGPVLHAHANAPQVRADLFEVQGWMEQLVRAMVIR